MAPRAHERRRGCKRGGTSSGLDFCLTLLTYLLTYCLSALGGASPTPCQVLSSI